MGVNAVERLWQIFSNTEGVKVSENLKNTKLGGIFVATLATAANTDKRNLSIWDKDKNNDLSALEMLNAIKAIRDENIQLNGNHKDKSVKVKDKDRYYGESKTSVNNEEAEILAFNVFAQINQEENFYDWTGKKGENQFAERSRQINKTDTRDAEKSVRVMLRDLDNTEINTMFKTETGMETPVAFYEKQLAYNGDKLNDLFVASYKVTDANAKLTVKIGKTTIKGTKEEILEQLAADGGISKEEQVAFIKAAVKAAQASANKDKNKKASGDGNSAEEIEVYNKMAELGFYYGTTKKAQKGKAAVDAKVQNGKKDAHSTARRMLRTLDTSELNSIINNSKQETISIIMQQEETVEKPTTVEPEVPIEPETPVAPETPVVQETPPEENNTPIVKKTPEPKVPPTPPITPVDEWDDTAYLTGQNNVAPPITSAQPEAPEKVSGTEEQQETPPSSVELESVTDPWDDTAYLTGQNNVSPPITPAQPEAPEKVSGTEEQQETPPSSAELESATDPWDDTEYLMKN